MSYGNTAWRRLSDNRKPRRNWLEPDPRPPCSTYRELIARHTVDAIDPDVMMSDLLEAFWHALACHECGQRMRCPHRDRKADLELLWSQMRQDKP